MGDALTLAEDIIEEALIPVTAAEIEPQISQITQMGRIGGNLVGL